MKKYLVGGFLIILVVGALAALTFAGAAPNAPAPSPKAVQVRRNLPKPTDAQRSELAEITKQGISLQQSLIDKYAASGWISADRASYMKDRLELEKKYAGKSGNLGIGGPMRASGGLRDGRGPHRGGMMRSGGMMSGGMMAPGAAVTDRPKPTEAQKAEIADIQKQMLTLREKVIDKYVEYGWITADKANYAKDQLELEKKYTGQFGGLGFGAGMGMMGGRRVPRGGGRGMMGTGPGARA